MNTYKVFIGYDFETNKARYRIVKANFVLIDEGILRFTVAVQVPALVAAFKDWDRFELVEEFSGTSLSDNVQVKIDTKE